MAVDRIKEINEERGKLFEELKHYQDKVDAGDGVDSELRERVDSINTLLGDLETEKDELELKLDIDKGLAYAEDRDEAAQAFQRTEVNQRRAERAGLMTKEQRAYGVQAYLRFSVGMPLTTDHEQALAMQNASRGLSRKGIELRMGTGFIKDGYGTWSRGRKRIFDSFDEEYREKITVDERAMSSGGAATGAELTPDEDFRAELIKTMVKFGPIRGVCRQISTTSGEPMRMPTIDDTANEADVKAESAASDFTDAATSEVLWLAHKYNAGVKYTYELLQDSPLAMQGILAELIGERQGRRQSKDMTTGAAGSTTTCKGIVNGASDSGAVWDLTPTNPWDNADALIDCQTSLDPAYDNSVGWMFNKATLGEIRKLKNSNGDYIWQPGLAQGEPDRLLNDPYVVNQSMPDASGTNRAIIFGDFSRYIIRDVGTMRLRVLGELYAETDELAIISWWRCDGRVALAEAIRYMATSA